METAQSPAAPPAAPPRDGPEPVSEGDRPTAARARRAASARPRLDPRFPVLLRGDGTVQLGSSPDRAVVVHPPPGVPPGAIATMLRLLDGTARLDRALRRSRMRAADAAPVLDELARAGLVTAGPPVRVPPCTVTVHGAGPLAERLREHLPSIGVRLLDSGREPHVDRIAESTASALVVLTDHLVVEPRVQQSLQSSGVPHMQVHLRDGAGVVGPLVLPGRTACLQCGDLHRRDADPAWPELMLRQLGMQGRADAPTVLTTAGVAAARVRAHLLGRTRRPEDVWNRPAAPPADRLVEIAPGAASMRVMPWAPHPECGCLPAPPVALSSPPVAEYGLRSAES